MYICLIKKGPTTSRGRSRLRDRGCWRGGPLSPVGRKKMSGRGLLILPLTFRDKLKFRLPTSSYHLFPHPFGHQSSLVHLMGSINPSFGHPRLASRHQLKVLKSVKNQGYLFLFELPFSIIIRIVYYKFGYLSSIISGILNNRGICILPSECWNLLRYILLASWSEHLHKPLQRLRRKL